MTATIRKNEQRHGIEIIFSAKPDTETLTALKAAGFRWHNAGGYWYGVETPARRTLAEQLAGGVTPDTPAPAGGKHPRKPAPIAPAVNKYGVKVGDLFHTSWGYDQTNNDFFQVIALCGESSVRVREVYPPLIGTEGISGMSEDRTYKISGEMLPPAPNSVFIKDQEHGDIKRLRRWDDNSPAQFKLASFANAYHIGNSGSIKVYESWYA